MSRELPYLPGVSRDFMEAVSYYEALSPQEALRFEEAFAVAEGRVTHLRVFDHYHRVFVEPISLQPLQDLDLAVSGLPAGQFFHL